MGLGFGNGSGGVAEEGDGDMASDEAMFLAYALTGPTGRRVRFFELSSLVFYVQERHLQQDLLQQWSREPWLLFCPLTA